MEKQGLKLREYFLGQLADDAAAAIELQIISDASLEEKLHSAESELMEDYLEEMLVPDEKDLFNKNFLVTAERQERLDFLRLLKKYAKDVGQVKKIHNLKTEEKPSFFDSLKNLLSLKPRPFPLLATVLILALAVGFSWRFFFYNVEQSEFARVEKAVHELNQKDLSNPSEYQNYSKLNLISGNLRSAGGKNSLAESNLTDTVFLRLTLPIEINSDKFYTAKLIKDGKLLITLNQNHTYQNQAGREIRLLLPASVLKKGEYQIELREENAPTENGKIFYTFTVQ
ncbi:MAG: hypothetical protein ACR2MG_11335 [Pyrinomonadaceae bacterium]